MVELCQALDLAGLNRSPLAMGLLTGKYAADTRLGDEDVRGKMSPAWVKYFKDGQPDRAWLKKVEAIREILTSRGRTLAQGALAWLWARSPQMIPIPGMRTVRQVEENASAMHFGPLEQDQMDEIERLLLKGEIKSSKIYKKLWQGWEKIKGSSSFAFIHLKESTTKTIKDSKETLLTINERSKREH